MKKECFNRWYGLVPYYLALTFSRMPIQIALNVMFSSLVYWFAGLPAELWRFATFASIGVIICLVADGLGLLIGATFNVTVSFNISIRQTYLNPFSPNRTDAQLVRCSWHHSLVWRFTDSISPRKYRCTWTF